MAEVIRTLFTRSPRQMGTYEQRWRPAIVFVGLGVLYSTALLTGPIRHRIALQIEAQGLVASAQSVIPILAVAVATVIMLLQRRIYSSRQLRLYTILTSMIIMLFLISTALHGVMCEAFAGAMILSIVAAVVWYGLLSTQERQILFRWVILAFFVYLTVNLAYWVLVLNPLENPSPGMPFKRMGGSLASVVHLGVLIPAFCAFGLALSERDRMSRLKPIMVCVSLLALIATGSRSGLCLVVVLLVMVIFSDSAKSVKALSGLVIGATLVVALSGTMSDYRYFSWNWSGGGRTDSWRAALSYWIGLGPSELLFGSGWGQVYPYWSWLSEGAQTWDGLNSFLLGSRPSLVSPHNSLVWIMVEGGLLMAIATAIFCVYPIIKIVMTCKKQRKQMLAFGCLSLVVLLLISDVLVTDPGTGFFVIALLLLSPDCS